MVNASDPPQEPGGDAPRDPWVGRSLGARDRYRILRRLGEGGFGTAYLAQDAHFAAAAGRTHHVVVKIPHAERRGDGTGGLPKDFLKEAGALTELQHANVLKVLDVGVHEADRTPYLVLEYAAHGSLDDRLRAAGGRQSLAEVLAWLPDVARALDYIHRKDVLHRDVKPSNILFDAGDVAHLADFGIVRIFGSTSKTGNLPGSPLYMGPEAMLAPVLDARYDQYALAVTVYEALSGRYPIEPEEWAGDAERAVSPITAQRLLYRKTSEAPVPLGTRVPTLPGAVGEVLARALSKDREARFASCGAFTEALREAANGRATSAPPPPQGPPTIVEPPPSDAGPVAPVGRERVPAGASRANARGGAGAGAASRGPSRRRGVLVALVVLAAAGAGFLAWSNRGREGAPGDTPSGGTTARERERPPETPRAPTATLSLAITSPAEGALLAANTVHVEGTVSGAAGVKVTVNGTDATVTGERYEADVVAATDGTLSLAVRASAPDAAPVTATRSVTVDTTAPVVRVVSPERGEATVASDVESVDVRVSASDPHLASVTVDGQPAVAQPDGTYAATVRLAAGETKTVSVVATDAAKHASAPVSVRLRREAPKPPPPPAWRADLDAAIAAALDGRLREAAGSWDAAVSKGMDAATAPPGLRRQIAEWKAPPELEVTTPTEGATTAEATVPVTGTLRTGRATDEVYVNGTRVRTGPGAFDVPVEVTEDEFTVRVEVKDGGVARGAAIERRVTRGAAPPPPAVPATPGWRSFLSGWAEPVGTALDEATKYPKRVRRTADGMEMVLIPAGTFPMGAVQGDKDASDDEKPRHSVTLTRAYYVDEHEVTVGMWRAYARATGKTMPTLMSEATDAHPIHKVSWQDVQGYLRWAQVALPTEAQWERAARGGKDDFVYPWGATDDAKKRNGYGAADGFVGLAPVKSYSANGYGLYDVSGNVWEWCADWYDSSYYGRSPPTDPSGPESGSSRVVRGGSWSSYGAGDLRASSRFSHAPSNAFARLGFRCARSLPAPGGG